MHFFVQKQYNLQQSYAYPMKTLRHQFSFSQLHFFFCVILILFVFCGSENAEATTINGDLVVDDNDQTTISSLTYVNGNVTVKDNGVLTIQSSTLQ